MPSSTISLTEPQQHALEEMRTRFAENNVATQSTSTNSSLIYFAIDDNCLLRYLRARNFDVNKAATMSFGIDAMLSEWKNTIVHENATGKLYVRGFDKEGHALLYMKPSLENTGDFDGNMKHLVFNIEVAIKSMRDAGRGAEKIILLVDYENWGLHNAPPLKTSQETMHILQNHYPERLHRAVAINPPLIFSVFWTAISPFIDPVTKAKILMLRYSPDVVKQRLLELIDAHQLESKYGGTDTVLFDSAAYLTTFYGPSASTEHHHHAHKAQ